MLPEHVAYVAFPVQQNIKWIIRYGYWLLTFSHVLFSLISDVFVDFFDVTDIDMAFSKLRVLVVRY